MHTALELFVDQSTVFFNLHSRKVQSPSLSAPMIEPNIHHAFTELIALTAA